MNKHLILTALLLTATPAFAANSALFVNNGTTSTANGVTVTGGTTGIAPSIAAAGSDTNINLVIAPQGTGAVSIGTTSAGSEFNVNGGVSIGTGYVGTAAPANGLIVQGDVGIGTASTSQALEVYGANSTYSEVASGATNKDAAIMYSDGTHTAYSGFLGASGGGTTGNYVVYNNGIVSFTVAGTGDVGIDTTSPINPLDVSGAVAIGTGYAGTVTAPTNGLIVQGNVGIGTSAPTAGTALDLGSNTNSMLLPSGTTGQRPTGVNGMIRYNSTTPAVEAYYGGNWNTIASAASSGYVKSVIMQTFTSSGTYTPSTGMLYALVRMVGGGAGGNTAGGGGGEYAEGVFSAATVGSSQTVTIGSGGAASSNGGTTSFGSLLTAVGGSTSSTSGTNANSFFAQGGSGGTGGTGSGFHVPGQAGQPGFGAAYNFQLYIGGNGGNSIFGAGGQGAGGTGSGYNAMAGSGYGAGGGGTAGVGSQQAGSAGFIEIIEFCSQ